MLELGELTATPRLFACDRLELAAGDTRGLRFHVSVALSAGERVLGLLHVVRPSEQALTEDETSLFGAAGRMIGIALERGGHARSGASAQEQVTMLSLTSRLLGSLDAGHIMDETAQIVAESFAVPLVGVYLYDEGTSALTLSAGVGWPQAPSVHRPVPLSEPQDLLAQTALRRRPQLVSGAAGELELSPQARHLGMTSAISAVMQVGTRLLGVIAAHSHDAGRFGPEDVRFLQSLADQAALALDRADLLAATRRQLRDLAALHERAAEQTRQLSDTYGATLAVLGDALELRDQETMGHTERVVSLAVSLGEELGLGQDDLLFLQWGAYVHDLGKIGVPDAVLRKPGPLSPDEWRLMQRHPEQGFTLLQRLIFLSRSLDVVRYHHERYDGGGYPSGLKGEEIPLLARIFAVADAYDAMTNDRPYRRALGEAEAVAELRRHRGKQFDPQVVDALLRLPEQSRSSVYPPLEDGLTLAASGNPLPEGGERLLAFARLCADVLRAGDLPQALDVIAEGIQREAQGSSCAILIEDAPGLGLHVAAQRGDAGEVDAAEQHETAVVRALRSEQPYYAPDVARERLTPLFGERTRSEFALPLRGDDETYGVLEVAAQEFDAFSPERRRAFEAMGLLAAFTVQRVRRESEIERLALSDSVTGLANRRAVEEAAEREFSRSVRHGGALALVSLSLDPYRELCQEDRRLADEALRMASRVMHQNCRREDVLGRREGGEFVFVLPETSKVGALLVAERLRADIGRLTLPNGRSLSVSVGIANLPEDGDTLEALMNAADHAMFKALRRGGNEVVAASGVPGAAPQDPS